jgi:hypothetical protein
MLEVSQPGVSQINVVVARYWICTKQEREQAVGGGGGREILHERSSLHGPRVGQEHNYLHGPHGGVSTWTTSGLLLWTRCRALPPAYAGIPSGMDPELALLLPGPLDPPLG